MVRAELRDGVFHPLDPIPAAWVPGQQLPVEQIDSESVIDSGVLDQWSRDLEEATAQLNDDQEWARIEQNLAEADKEAKEYVRREMGLS